MSLPAESWGTYLLLDATCRLARIRHRNRLDGSALVAHVHLAHKLLVSRGHRRERHEVLLERLVELRDVERRVELLGLVPAKQGKWRVSLREVHYGQL